MSNDSKNKLILIDGYGFVFRAFYASPPLTRSDGTPIGAVYTFTSMILKLMALMDATHLAVVFDAGKDTFRNEMYKEYKANRPECPEDLKVQFPIIREATEAMNLPILEKVGYEADDIIATLAKKAEEEGYEVMIVSSDKDLMQLVDENISMFDAVKEKIIGIEQVREKFGVAPDKVLDVLSLMGDSSDNIPGAPGIGPKTATELINTFGSLKELLNRAGEIKQNKRRETIENNKDKILLSKDLATLKEDVLLGSSLQDLEIRGLDPEKFLKFTREQGFISITKKFEKCLQETKSCDEFIIKEEEDAGSDLLSQINNDPKKSEDKKFSKKSEKEGDLNILNDLKHIVDFLDKAIWQGFLAISFEFDGEDEFNPEVLSISLTRKTGETVYIPVLTKGGKSLVNGNLFDDTKKSSEKTEESRGFELSKVLDLLKNVLQDNSVLKVAHNIKILFKFLKENDIELVSFEDIMVISYILDAGRAEHSLSELIKKNLEAKDYKKLGLVSINHDQLLEVLQQQEKGKKLFDLIEDNGQKITELCNFKSGAVAEIYYILKQRIYDEQMSFIYERFERPLTEVLAAMEIEGVGIDIVQLKQMSDDFVKEISGLEKEIYELAGIKKGEEFNIGSPKQLSEILFERLSLPVGKKSSKTGLYSTNSDVLEELDLMGHTIAGKILEWRHLSKLKSTYTDVLPKQINPKTGRVHTTFSNVVASTGRLSSNNPNLQNIPIRSKEGNKIRQAFTARKGHKLISADYSQVELRVLSHVAEIEELRKAFREDKDIHAITASQIFGVTEKEVTSDMRRKSKAINFGIIYGISPFGLARQIKVSKEEAGLYIKEYFKKYPGIQEYMERSKEFAKKYGFVKTLFGRKCYIEGINDRNAAIRNFAERLAINAPMQGSAADIIKKAMIDLYNELQEQKLKSKLILQVHDELVVEAPENEVKLMSNLLKEVMEKTVMLTIPLKVEVGIGNNWAEIH